MGYGAKRLAEIAAERKARREEKARIKKEKEEERWLIYEMIYIRHLFLYFSEKGNYGTSLYAKMSQRDRR